MPELHKAEIEKFSNGVKRVLTTCPYCGVGCGFYLDVRDGKIVGVIPSKSNSVSKGYLCVKGWHAHEPVQHPDRLTKPLITKNGKFITKNLMKNL